jgi:tetratricopeptide (TPR) repeat protein
LAIDSGYANFWVNKAIALSYDGDKQGAINAYDQALNIDDTKFQARKAKAIIYFNTGNYKAAIQNFDQALAINSGDASLWVNK